MCQLPLDSQLATASQLTDAALAVPLVPRSTAPPAAPASTRPANACQRERVEATPLLPENMEHPPRLRGELSGSAEVGRSRAVPRLHPEARLVRAPSCGGSPASACLLLARPIRGGIRRTHRSG